jgi:hypothetical protein
LLPLDVQSDVRLLTLVLMAPQPGATGRRSVTQPQVRPVLRGRVREHLESQEPHAEEQLPARPVSQAQPQVQQPVVQSSLSPPQPSRPLPLLPLPPNPENAFAPARRARYQSSLSASSFP